MPRPEEPPTPGSCYCLSGGGEMGALIRSIDWSKTPLGAVDSWSPALCTMISFLLANRFPLLLWWGPQYCQVYNDPYRPVLGTKHPRSMGQPARECWPEIWPVIRPLIETPFSGGAATWMDDIFLEINRHGFVEETHFTIAYSPVPDATVPSGIGGVLATMHEITEKVVGERRLLLLRDLGARSAEAKTAEEACGTLAETLSQHSKDVPFALVYLTDSDGKRALLAGAAGITLGEPGSPSEVDLEDQETARKPWPLAGAIRTGSMQVVEDLGRVLPHAPQGPWSDPPQSAVVLPIRSRMAHRIAGALVLGVSPRLRFDDNYREFCGLVASQAAIAIANASAYQEERGRAEALSELDRAKTAFFGNVSHEFRTPLTLMLGPVQDMLARAGDPLLVRREELDLLHRNTLRVLKLVNALLDFSRIEAGKTEASYEPTNLAALTEDIASAFRSGIEKAGLRLTVDCAPLPTPVFVDRAMWEKIVLNLLSNAFKFTFEGGISVSLRQVGQNVELSVSDTGTGIPQDELPHLFKRFHQVKGVRGRNYEGSGIGLALVQELADLHNGTVRVESVQGRGSRFRVSIPMCRTGLPDRLGSLSKSFTVGAAAYADQALHWLPDDAASAAAEDARSRPAKTAAAQSSRILLAEDNADMRRYLSRLLSDSFDVSAVVDGEAALAMARENPPDLVLSDVMMPSLDGFGLLQALRSDPRTRDVPVILLSARAGEEARVEGMQAGAVDYLVKPFSARELLARVHARLESARLHRETKEKERFVAQIAELTPVVIIVRDLITGLSTYASRDITTLTGYTSEDVDRMADPFAIWDPDDVRRHRDRLTQVNSLKDGEIFDFEYRIRRRDGEWRWLTTRAMPFSRAAQGELRQVITATLDITSRKQAEAALHASEERFRRYFELGLIGMAITSPEKGCLEVNDEICRILGYERSELVNKTWAEMTHPDDLARDVELFQRVMAGEIEGYTLDKRWIRKDGQIIDSTISVNCVRREDGSVEYFMALLQDITARKRTEEALEAARADLERRVEERTAELITVNQVLKTEIAEREHAEIESRAFKEALAAELEAMVRLHDFSTRLLASTEMQPLLEEILNAIMSIQSADFGLVQVCNLETGALEVAIQRGFQEDFLVRFANAHDETAAYSRALHRRRRVIIEDIETDPDYAPRRQFAAAAGYRSVQSTPLFDRRGEPLAIVSTHFRKPHRPSERDLRLTDLYVVHAAELFARKRAETAVLRYQQELRALTARLIDAQETESKYLARELHDDVSQKLAVLGMEMAALAQRAVSGEFGSRLLDLTGQVGNLAKDIHRISRQLHPAILDDLGLAAALRNECAAFQEQYGIRVDFDPDDLPRELPEDVSLCLYRVAQECLRNVFKHANATEVRVKLTARPREIRMEIADTGHGFEQERVHGEGGLGLISMEERVRLVNGALSVRSQPGKGTHVNVRIPLHQEET